MCYTLSLDLVDRMDDNVFIGATQGIQMATEVIVFHRIQPDYERRMKMMSRAALFWAQDCANIPMSLVPTKEQWIEERQEELIARWIQSQQPK